MLIELDKAGAEWVITAYASGDARMIQVCEGADSPHVVTGHLISKAPKELIEREHKIVGGESDPDNVEALRKQLPELIGHGYFLPRSMSIRQAGKKSNHGLNYGMGYRRFALENEIDESEAKKIVELYTRQAYPSLPLWWETIERQLRKDRTLTNCFGRRCTFYDAWSTELLNAAYSFIPQSTNADCLIDATDLIYTSEEACLENWELMANVHDSLLCQWLGSDVMECAQAIDLCANVYMNPVMEYAGREFRIKTDCKIGLSWDDMRAINIRHRDLDRIAQDIKRIGEELGAW